MAQRHGLWIGGASVPTSQWDAIRNPYTGEVFAEVCIAGESEVLQAIEAAQKAYEPLKSLTRGERSDILHSVAETLRKHRAELAHWLVEETGKPIDACLLEMDRAAMTIKLSAEEAIRNVGEVVAVDFSSKNKGYRALYERFPLGPISAITPFNFPLNLSAHKIGPALAAGNPVVLKPAVQCPTLLLRFAEIAHLAGVPAGALNVVHCHPPAAERLATDERIRLLSFTGSAQVGWHLKNIAGKKRVLLELGGNAGAAVHSDADLAHAAKRLALGAFYQSGQVCISAQRIYIQRSVFDSFVDFFLKETRLLAVGDPKEAGTVIGPMIDEKSARRIEEWADEALQQGAKVLLRGARTGSIVPPIVLTDVPKNARIACEEAFGPVALLERYDTFDEAMSKINDTRYGLQASVFTQDARQIDRAFRTLEVGGVIVNDFPNFRTDNYPYGGIKDSGHGREGVRFAMEEMSEKKMLVVNVEG